MQSEQRKVICLAPVRNEEWVLERFLKSAEKWADLIIIADQHSTDKSVDIARSHPKVKLIINESTQFNESARQKLLIDEARNYGSNNILVALDADELLSDNAISSSDWAMIKKAEAGTAFSFDFVNIMPNFTDCWVVRHSPPIVFIDDGASHVGKLIHSTRVPVSKASKTIHCSDIKILHLQYIEWARMQSKQRWYMAWEYLNESTISTTKLYRTYSHMHSFRKNGVRSINTDWISPYMYSKKPNTDKSLQKIKFFHWDQSVLEMFQKHGINHFSRVPIWDAPWTEIAKELNMYVKDIPDPRSKPERHLQSWLKNTQNSRFRYFITVFDLILIKAGF